jgi:hypothetical protein
MAACPKVFIGCKVFVGRAMFPVGSLGESWFSMFEMLQNGDYVLLSRACTPVECGVIICD